MKNENGVTRIAVVAIVLIIIIVIALMFSGKDNNFKKEENEVAAYLNNTYDSIEDKPINDTVSPIDIEAETQTKVVQPGEIEARIEAVPAK